MAMTSSAALATIEERKDSEESVQVLHEKLLQDMEQAIRGKRYDQITILKKLIESTLEKSYINLRPEIFGDIISKAIRYTHSLVENRGESDTILAQIFDLNAQDMPYVDEAFRRNDEGYLAWFLVKRCPYDQYIQKKYAAYLEWHYRHYPSGEEAAHLKKYKEFMQEAQDFQDKVYQCVRENSGIINLPSNIGGLLRSAPQILSDLKGAHSISRSSKKQRDLDVFMFHAHEARAHLEEALLHKDVFEFSTMIGGIWEQTILAKAQGGYFNFIKGFSLRGDEASIARLLLQQKENKLLLWTIINRLNLESLARYSRLTPEELNQFKDAVYERLSPEGNLLRSPEEIEVQAGKYLEDENENGIIISKLEMQALLQEAFLRKDAETFAKGIEAYIRLAKRGIHIDKEDFVSQLLELEEEELALFVDLLHRDGEFRQMEHERLAAFWLIEYLDLEIHPHVFNQERQEIKDIESFKQHVYDRISWGSSLVFSPEEFRRWGHELLSIEDPNDLELYKAHFDAAFVNAYQQADTIRLAQYIRVAVEMALVGQSQGRLNPILRVLDIPQAKRDEFLRHLYENDKDAALYVFVEVVLDGYKNTAYARIHEKGGLNFRLDICKQLNVVPPTLLDVPHNYQLQGEFGLFHQILDWAAQLKEFNANDPLMKQYLPMMAKRAYQENIQVYLRANMEDKAAAEKICDLLTKLQLIYKLGHRFGLKGEMVLEGIKIDLEGSFITEMVRDLQLSHRVFQSASENYLLAKELIQKEISEIRISDSVYESICQDTTSDALFITPEVLAEQVKGGRAVSIPTLLKTDDPTIGHYVNVTFSGALCLIADNSRIEGKAGIRIFRVGNSYRVSETIAKLQKSHRDIESSMSHDTFEQTLIQTLSLREISEPLEYKGQKTGNCGWSSSAKMMLRSVTLGHFYQYFVKQGIDLEQSMVLAKKASKLYAKIVFEDDRERFLRSFIDTFCDQTELPPQVLERLAEIAIRMKHRPIRQPLIHVLESRCAFSPEIVVNAERHLLERVKEALEKANKKESRVMTPEEVEAKSQVWLTMYLAAPRAADALAAAAEPHSTLTPDLVMQHLQFQMHRRAEALQLTGETDRKEEKEAEEVSAAAEPVM